MYSAPLNRFSGFLQTLHSIKMPTQQSVSAPSTTIVLMTTCTACLPETLGLGSVSPLTDVKRPVVELLSTPPRRGRRWLTDTCSMKEVPYLRKYHHSNICHGNKDSGNISFKMIPHKAWIYCSFYAIALSRYDIIFLFFFKYKSQVGKSGTSWFSQERTGLRRGRSLVQAPVQTKHEKPSALERGTKSPNAHNDSFRGVYCLCPYTHDPERDTVVKKKKVHYICQMVWILLIVSHFNSPSAFLMFCSKCCWKFKMS